MPREAEGATSTVEGEGTGDGGDEAVTESHLFEPSWGPIGPAVRVGPLGQPWAAEQCRLDWSAWSTPRGERRVRHGTEPYL